MTNGDSFVYDKVVFFSGSMLEYTCKKKSPQRVNNVRLISRTIKDDKPNVYKCYQHLSFTLGFVISNERNGKDLYRLFMMRISPKERRDE